MLNNIVRDEVPREGRKRLVDSDRHSATHFTIGAPFWQQTYQSSNDYIHKQHYGPNNEHFRPKRCTLEKRAPQIDMDYAKNYKNKTNALKQSETQGQYGPKPRSVRQPLHTYHELMRTDNYQGSYEPNMKSTCHQHFSQNKPRTQPSYSTKHLTEYDIVTNKDRPKATILQENTFERFYPEKKVARFSSNRNTPHTDFVMRDLVGNRDLPYMRPKVKAALNL